MKTLRELRIQAKLTLSALGGAIGVSTPFMHEVETGKKALPERLYGPLAKALDAYEEDVRRACPPLRVNISDLSTKHRAEIAEFVAIVRRRDVEERMADLRHGERVA